MRSMKLTGLLLAVSLVSTFCGAAAADRPDDHSPLNLLPEFRPIGGGGNNLHHPELDSIPNSPERALAPLNFAPGTENGLVKGPNPRLISNVIAGGTGENGQNGQTDDPVASAWLYIWGQFVDHDMSLEGTPPSNPSINIAIPDGDPAFPKGTSITLNRDSRDPRTNTIVNTIAGYLDLSQLYGSTAAVASSMRNDDGTLKTSYDGYALPIVNNSFVAGDVRVMENPELTATTTVFLREHNFWVAKLRTEHPGWTADQLFEMARAITTAEYQNIIYTQYLPLLIGPILGPYTGYDDHVNAQVTEEFSTAVFRMGHSQVSDTQQGLDAAGNVIFTQGLAEAFFNTPAEDMEHGFDPLLRHAGADYSQATDVYTVATLRNLLNAGLVGGDVDVIDLIAIDIQRERDVGLGSLNETRRAIGLRPYRSFAELTQDPTLCQNLEKVYGDVDNVDLFIGGLAEKPMPGALVGQTFQAIIAEQFYAMRAGDRFFWQNQAFDRDTMDRIAKTSLADILERNTSLRNLQRNVFIEADVGTTPHVKTHAMKSDIDNHGRPLPPPFTQKH